MLRLSFELPRRLHLTRLLVSSYALHTSTRLLVCSAAGPVLRSSPHLLLWRGGAQLRRGTARDLHRDLARAGWCMHSPRQLVESKFRNPAALLPPNLATLVATFHRHAKFTISTDQRAKLSKPRGAAVQPTPSAARLLVVGLGVEPSARPRSTPSMPISAPSLCALPALLALPALPT